MRHNYKGNYVNPIVLQLGAGAMIGMVGKTPDIERIERQEIKVSLSARNWIDDVGWHDVGGVE